ncbi:MAG: glycosyltransferase family 39 protein [Planctomycetota bacterium]|nr:MAG: glycosyltransferase family 39 protein [Planctomycetota bacterium]
MQTRTTLRSLIPAALLLLVFTCIIYLSALGSRDIWAPEEGYYALEAKEMLQRGDWLVPHVNGMPRLQKPVLYHWFVLLFGRVTETTARIPSAIAAILTVLVTFLFASMWFGRRTGIITGIILSTTTLFLWHARYAGTDMLLVLFVTASCFMIREALRENAGAGLRPAPATLSQVGPGRRNAFLIAGFAIAGVAVLSKGPVGVVLPALAVIASLLWKRRAVSPPREAFLYGTILLLLIAIPWYVLAIKRAGQGYELIVRQNFTRFLSPWDHEGRGWYFYLARLPLDLLPWSFFIPAIFAFFIKHHKPDPQDRFLICWAVTAALFFLASGSRQGKYFLPMYPAFAVLTARALEGFLFGKSESSFFWWVRGGMVAFAAAAFIASAIYPAGINMGFKQYPQEASTVAAGAKWFLIPLLIFGTAVTICSLFSWGRAGVISIAIFMVAAHIVTVAALLPSLDPFKSPRHLADAVIKNSGPETRNAILGAFRPGVAFYSGKKFEVLPVRSGKVGRQSAARCRVFLAEPGSRLVLMPDKHLGLIRDSKGRLPPNVQVLERMRLGSRFHVLVGNRKK